ncbi:MAG: hypothetical protein IT221_16480 [Fluviicola sp.]|nr:hypothetical protein [Fluviicola sp.]
MKKQLLYAWILTFGCSSKILAQSDYDSTFVVKIIQSELKQISKTYKTTITIFEIAQTPKSDSIYNRFLFSRELNWNSFKIKQPHCQFTKFNDLDSLFYIHNPQFSEDYKQLKITFEKRYLNGTSTFMTDYYCKKRKKWSFIRTQTYFSF